MHMLEKIVSFAQLLHNDVKCEINLILVKG